jgi:UDP-N-acetylmuramate: L-alanyl-gamma-D-glutamyl-meso-diaminopimelate ligase
MHNLALALHNKGYKVTGSDDAIFEPSQSRLDKKDVAFRNGLVSRKNYK